MDPLGDQLEALQQRYPAASLEAMPDGARVLVVPGVGLGEGWSATETTLRILVPVGFPQVNPDCFYVDSTLTLASGMEPQNSQLQPVFGGTYRWFSWHPSSWDAASCNLGTYVRFCERRLRECR
jgi:hypothetical protein